jgi:hypothetical protein
MRDDRGVPVRTLKPAFSIWIAFAIWQTGGAGTAHAAPQAHAEMGSLDCVVGPSAGLVSGRQFARCTFRPKGAGGNKNYFVRLSQVGRWPGLPSGGKLAWLVRMPEPGAASDLSGRYSQAAEGAEANPYTLCRSSVPPVCMTPAPAGGGRKPNLAPVILEMSVEVSPIRRRKPAESK